MKTTTGKARALISRGLRHTCILATDDVDVAREVENLGTDNADEVLGDWFVPEEPGLYLFEGEGKWQIDHGPEGPYEPELNWTGVVRQVTPEEVPGLLEMHPPEDEGHVHDLMAELERRGVRSDIAMWRVIVEEAGQPVAFESEAKKRVDHLAALILTHRALMEDGDPTGGG